MTVKTRTIQFFNIIGGLSLFVLALFGVFDLFSPGTTAYNPTGLAPTILLYAVILRVNRHNGIVAQSISRLPVVVAWILFNLQIAAFVAIAGSLIAMLLTLVLRDEDMQSTIDAFLPSLANAAVGLAGIELVYMLMQGGLPHLTDAGMYASMTALVMALVAGSLLSLILQTTAGSITLDTVLRKPDVYLLNEVFVVLCGLLLPLILIQLNAAFFIIVNIVVALVIYRQVQMTHAVNSLQVRVDEMTTLSSMSSSIISQLSTAGTIEAVHDELQRVLNTTSTYLALYDEDHDILTYQADPFKEQDGSQSVTGLDAGLAHYIIRTKQPLHHQRDDMRRVLKNLHDVSHLNDAQYMVAPLKVSTKVIGIIGVSHATDRYAFSQYDFALFQAIASQASLALRNATLYDRTVRLADNLSIINQSIQHVMFNLDRHDALKASCQIAANVMRTPKAAIYLLDKDNIGLLKRIESIGFDGTPPPEALIYRIAQFEQGARVITDVAKSDDPDVQAHAAGDTFKAFVQLPLRSGTAIIGTLNVYHDRVYFYETPELNLLEMLTNQITAALDNADLLQALELYAAEQAQLVHLSRVSGETLDLESIIIGVCKMMAQMMQVTRVAIGIQQSDKETLRLESSENGSFGLSTYEVVLDDVPEIAAIIAPNSPSALRVYTLAEDTTVSQGLKRYMHDQGDKTLALLPMRVNDKTTGLILLGDVSARQFNDNDLRLLEMANNQITVQIQNALVHTRTEQQLANRLEQLELIEDISQQISESMELDLIIQNVLEAALQSTQADFASMALVDPSQPHTFDIVWREVVDNRLIPNRIHFEESGGVIGHVCRTGEMLILPDNAAFEDYVAPFEERATFRSSLAIPMKTSNAVIGVLNLESYLPDFFTGEQALFLNSLAGHAAISIDNANLLIEREQQIHTLTLLRELSLDALSFIQRDEIYAAVIRTALILLNGTACSLYGVDARSKRFDLLSAVQSHDGQMLNADPTIPDAILLETMQRGSLRLIADVSQEAAFDGQTVDYRSLIVLPVARRNQIQELLCITFATQREFSHHDLNMIDSLAVQAAGHLENAALNDAITTSNDRMRAILDSTRDGIILLDRQQRIQDANSAAIMLTGVDLSQYLFKMLDSIATDDGLTQKSADTFKDITEAYYETPENIHNQEYELHHDETIVFIKTLVQPVNDDNGDAVGHLLILRDITDEKNLQRFQTTMQSMVLHDLRGPLTSIVTSMYVAENILALYDGSDFEDLKDSLMKTFGVSLVSAEDMLRQVDTLRDLPMLSQMEVNPQMLPIFDIAEGAFNSLAANYQDSNIDVELAIDPETPVFVDESLIRRVIINLMHNAFKFTPEDGKVLVQVNESSPRPDYLRIDVADTGPGIPDAERERIFGQYIQIKGNKPRAGGKGTGLGLNFCKLAVEAHGGEIWVAGDGPLPGACFSFIIPTGDWRPAAQQDDIIDEPVITLE